MNCIGIVIIGRNEGERLVRSLGAARSAGVPAVYVDSGSSDGSVALARTMIGQVVQLDAQRPFTAARARNEGLRHLQSLHPELDFVQFVDGDCELHEHWLAAAIRFMLTNPDIAALCGNLVERNASASIYKRLCDIEWRQPHGEIPSCGGSFLARIDALRGVDGFDPSIAAGEEAELCQRLQHHGWMIHRIDEPMAQHDGDITSFRRWWKRAMRSGAGTLDRTLRDKASVRGVLSIVFWSTLLPLIAIGAAWFTAGASLVLLLAYPVQWMRIRWALQSRGVRPVHAGLGALFTLLAKWAEMSGMVAAAARHVQMQSAERGRTRTESSPTTPHQHKRLRQETAR